MVNRMKLKVRDAGFGYKQGSIQLKMAVGLGTPALNYHPFFAAVGGTCTSEKEGDTFVD